VPPRQGLRAPCLGAAVLSRRPGGSQAAAGASGCRTGAAV